MSVAESRVGDGDRPTILVVAVPYVLATALACKLQALYNVVAPNVGAGESAPSMRWDAVLTLATVAIRKDISGLIIELPNTSFDEPVMVTVNERTTPVRVTPAHPIDDVVALLEHHLSSSA
jgi:hypothetical protein